MTPTVVIITAILGLLAAITLLASALLFLYVARELRRILDWLREFTKMYLGMEVKTGESTEGVVKYEKMWDEEKDGRG